MTTTVSPATTSAAAPASSAVRPAVWTHVSEGLWVGAREGEFVGTVEFIDGGFTASDHRGIARGRVHSLAAAKALADNGAADDERVLRWRNDRRTLAIGWTAFAVSAVAAVAIAAQLFV